MSITPETITTWVGAIHPLVQLGIVSYASLRKAMAKDGTDDATLAALDAAYANEIAKWKREAGEP